MPASRKPVRFRAVIELEGINPYVRVSPERAARVRADWRKPMPVRVRINGKPDAPWRINMMPKGGGLYFLYLHAVVRQASGTGVGSAVSVEIVFDEAYRPGPPPLPAWLRAAFKARPEAAAGFGALTPGRRREIVRYLSNLKSAEARARNLDKALRVLSGEKGRFMARDWAGGR
jgi:hypothetical protein